MVSGKKLYEEIKQKIKGKKLYIVGHSHGTDVLMHAINYAIKIGDDDFLVEHLVLWGSPISNFTEEIIHKKNSRGSYFINKVYNVYSPDDVIQVIDLTHNFPCCKRTLKVRPGLFNIRYKQKETLFHLNILHLFSGDFKDHLQKLSSQYSHGFFVYLKDINVIIPLKKRHFLVTDFLARWGLPLIVAASFYCFYTVMTKKYSIFCSTALVNN